MKILQVINELGMGGAENLLVILCSALKEQGHDVEIVALSSFKSETLEKKLSEKGIKVAFLSDNNTFYKLSYIFKLAKLIKQYDVVHVHLFPALYYVGIAKLLTRRKTPLLYTEHSTWNKRRGSKILHAMDKYIYGHCYDRVVACSDKARDTFKEAFPTLDISVINNGVCIDDYMNAIPFEDRSEISVPKDAFVVTMVASFRYPKRQDTIVEAIAMLEPDVHLVLVGVGDNMEFVKQRACDLNVLDRVHFLGVRSDVPRILKSSDVVVMSSEYEGLSLSSIEGMASGKPFVATDANGLREVVDGAGLLFEVGDYEQLANIIKDLRKDQSFNKSVVIRCIERAKQYDIKCVAKQYSDVYQSVNRFIK